MAIDSQYGKVKVRGIPDGEQIRILRSADLAAPRTLAAYREACGAVGCGDDYIAGVSRDEASFREFQADAGPDVTLPADRL